jgi:hypothetical protein
MSAEFCFGPEPLCCIIKPVDVQYDVILRGFCGRLLILHTIQRSNYIRNLPDNDLIKWKLVIEETTVVHNNVTPPVYECKKLHLQDCPCELNYYRTD